MWRPMYRTSAETMVYRAKDVYVAPLALTAQHQIIQASNKWFSGPRCWLGLGGAGNKTLGWSPGSGNEYWNAMYLCAGSGDSLVAG